MKRRAVLSVFDKTGIVDFAKELIGLGFEIISTGGTQTALEKAGIDVTNISDITGFPECLDGRVKTLHPKIHAGILAMRANPEHMKQISDLGVSPVDVVAINLYPFKQTISKPDVTREDAIENIDIGGPTMLRAAAKNWQDMYVAVDPEDYAGIIEHLKSDEASTDFRLYLSYKVFEHTAAYDTLISDYMRKQVGIGSFPQRLSLTYEKIQEMRYGENPHQKAAFYKEISSASCADQSLSKLPHAEQLWGKELSYNNINDANGALDLLKDLTTAYAADPMHNVAAVAVKHANPCGAAVSDNVFTAYQKAYDADPVSIFGGIVAVNATVDAKTATEMSKIFLEIIIAPDFEPEALEILKAKKNIRLLKLPDCGCPNKSILDMKKVAGGLLVQELDEQLIDRASLRVVTNAQPSDEQMKELEFAFAVVKHTKSNGIVLTKDFATVGVGPGQTNRITALELAIKYGGENVRGSVLASDAFFPFSDCVEAAFKAGVTAIIQPGGSIKDQASIDLCNEYNIPMVFTGMRHFKH